MGTRGFTGFKIDGKIHLSYQQYDSYPSGVGMQTIEGLARHLADITESLGDLPADMQAESAVMILGARFRTMRVVGEDEVLTAEDRAKYAAQHDPGVSTGEDNYSLFRNLQGDIGAMLDAQVMLDHDKAWPLDSLFCEWGYLVNFSLPEPSLEVYQGFRSEVATEGEWAGVPAEMEDIYGPWPKDQTKERKVIGRRPSEYFPVQRVAAIPLTDVSYAPATAAMLNIEREDAEV